MPRLKLIAVHRIFRFHLDTLDIHNPCFSYRKRKAVFCLFLNYCTMHCGKTVCRLGRGLVTTSFHDEAFLFPIEAQRVAQCNSKIQGLSQKCNLFSFPCFGRQNMLSFLVKVCLFIESNKFVNCSKKYLQ